MKLPSVRFSDGINKGKQVKFGGLNHNLGAKDGEIWNMRNLTSDYYPLLASRAPRMLYKQLGVGDAVPGVPLATGDGRPYEGGLFSWEKLCWVDGMGFYYGGVYKGDVTAGNKTFAALGVYIIILPDKKYYNTDNGEFGSLESKWSGTSLTFTNGRLFDEAAEANTLQASGVNWNDYFLAGDAVTIAGATQRPQNNKTAVIREIDGNRLYFYENVFTLAGANGTTPYTETGQLSVSRTVPDMLYICENENRLWGCDRTTIYSTKLGDIYNWNVFEGLDTDSYAVDTGSAGIFTGCVSFLGYPIFFKEEHIYKIYGSMPSNYELMGSATLGVADGSSRSLAIAGEMLFYLSRAGIMAYSGGIPQPVGAAFGLERHSDAVAGSDGLKYYVSMGTTKHPPSAGDCQNTRRCGATLFAKEGEDYMLYVYDTQRGLWHTEDDTRALYFARADGNLYFVNDKGEIWATKHPVGDAVPGVPQDDVGIVPYEPPVKWFAEFADFTDDDPNKKGISKIQIRIELDAGAKAKILMRFDSKGRWQKVAGVAADVKRSYYLAIVPRRADHYRLKIEGTGGCRVYSLTREYYSGSEL